MWGWKSPQWVIRECCTADGFAYALPVQHAYWNNVFFLTKVYPNKYQYLLSSKGILGCHKKIQSRRMFVKISVVFPKVSVFSHFVFLITFSVKKALRIIMFASMFAWVYGHIYLWIKNLLIVSTYLVCSFICIKYIIQLLFYVVSSLV